MLKKKEAVISIIVPIYNTSKYLKQCLLSIQNQTMRNIEVICVNDGSTDDSQRIIDSFVKEDSRFRGIVKKNTGYGHSVNLGIMEAGAPYIGIVESDDFIELDMYEKLYTVMEDLDVDFVKADFYEYTKGTEWEGTGNRRYHELISGLPYGQIFSPHEYPLAFGVHPSVWSALYKKDFLLDNQIFFAETPGASYQDIDFNFKLFACAEKVYFIKEALLNYRIDNMESSINRPEKIFCVCDEIKDIQNFVEQRKRQGRLGSEWADTLITIQMWIMARNYIWNYHRLSGAFKYAFLLEMQREFAKCDLKRLEMEIWSEGEKQRFRDVLEDAYAFYEQSTKDYEDPRMETLPLLNHFFQKPAFEKLIEDATRIYVYGAGPIGQRVLKYLMLCGLKHKVQGVLVSSKEGNPAEINNVPVNELGSCEREIERDALILLALQKKWHYEVAAKLIELGFQKVLYIDDYLKQWIYENIKE